MENKTPKAHIPPYSQKAPAGVMASFRFTYLRQSSMKFLTVCVRAVVIEYFYHFWGFLAFPVGEQNVPQWTYVLLMMKAQPQLVNVASETPRPWNEITILIQSSEGTTTTTATHGDRRVLAITFHFSGDDFSCHHPGNRSGTESEGSDVDHERSQRKPSDWFGSFLVRLLDVEVGTERCDGYSANQLWWQEQNPTTEASDEYRRY